MEIRPVNRIAQFIRSRAARVAIIYMIAAVIWIFTSSYLLPQTVDNPKLQWVLGIANGLLFVLVTGTLLYVTLRNWTAEIKQPDKQAIFEFKIWNRVRIIPATLALVIFLPLLVYLIYLLNAPALEREGLARLQGKANIQAIHIESWLKQRNADAEVLYHNHTLSEIVNSLQQSGSDKARDIVTEYLQEIRKSYDYEAVILFDKESKPLLTLGEHTAIPAITMALINEARRDNKIKHNHQFTFEGEHIHTDYVVPLSSARYKTTGPDAFVIMRSKLNDILTRTSRTQPGMAAQDSVLLIHLNSEQLIAFDTTTGKRHHTRKGVKLQDHLPAVIASHSTQTNTVITTDYRGKSVLAAWRHIADTDWFILAKIDRNIVLAPLWSTLGWVALVGTFLIAAIIALLHMLWSRQQYYQELEKLAQEKQADQLLKHFFDMPFLGMAIWSAKNGEWVRFNDRLCDMLGYSRERMQTLSWEQLSLPEDLAKEQQAQQSILEGKTDSYTLEKRLQRIDHSILSANIDVHCVQSESGEPDIMVAIIQDITAYRRTIEALRESEQRFRSIFDGVLDGILLTDKESHTFLTSNAAFCNMLGYTEEEIPGMSMRDIHPEESLEKIESEFAISASGSMRITEDVPILRKDGSVFTADIKGSTVVVGDKEYVLAIFRDTTERIDYENRLRRLSQFYAALSQCNETIIRSTNETELLQEICRITVQHIEINTAWIGMITNDEQHLQLVSGYGPGTDEIALAMIEHDKQNELNESPSYQAMTQDQAIWLQNFPETIASRTWQEMAASYGWLSAAALPLKRQGTVVGVLNLYAHVEQAFDEQVRELLVEMANDISFALDNFTLEERRITSEKSLTESEQRFRGLVEQSLSGIYIIQDDRYVYANPRLAHILGFDSEDDLVGKRTTDFIVAEDRDTASTQLHNLINGKSNHLAYEARAWRSDGQIIDIGVHGAIATHLGLPAVIGLIQDVTDKKRAEEQLNSYVDKLKSSLMQTVEVANRLSEMRDPYTSGHERRVAEIAVAIGREMALEEHQLEGLRVSGYLHDIGKITIPSEILAKPAKLTALEYEIIKGHPEASFNVLKDVDFPWPVALVALQHHERIDGSGYPGGLIGEEIILEARITAVADVVEAMGSHRPYRPGLGIDPALEEIERGKGTLYDQSVVEACLRLFREKGYSLPA